MKFSKLKEMSAYEVGKLSGKQLREAYQNVKKVINSRVKTFEAHDAGSAIPASLRGGLESSRGRSEEDLLQDIRNALRWSRGSGSSYRTYARVQENRRQKMQEALPDIDLSSTDKLKEFGNFMNDVSERYGEMAKIVSSQARALYSEAQRLNINKNALLKNMDYWLDHLNDLEKTDPIRTRSERQLQPSEYARKLGLEKIGGGSRRR